MKKNIKLTFLKYNKKSTKNKVIIKSNTDTTP